MGWVQLDQPRWLHPLLEPLWGSRDGKGLVLRMQMCFSLSNNLCKVLRFESCIRLPEGLLKPRLLPHPEVQVQGAWHGWG